MNRGTQKMYTQRIEDLVRAAEDEAARSNFQAAIYKLTDALKESVAMTGQLADEIENERHPF